MHEHPPATPAKNVPALLSVEAFAACLAPQLAVTHPRARMSVAVAGAGVWSFPIASPAENETRWDPEADLQILCDPAALDTLATGQAITGDRLFLVSGDDALLDRLGKSFVGGGTPLQVRTGGRR